MIEKNDEIKNLDRNSRINDVIESKNKNSLLHGMIFLLLYQIGYTVIPGLNIWVLLQPKGVSSELPLIVWMVKHYFMGAILIALFMTSMILIRRGIYYIEERKKDKKTKTVKILAIILMIHPIYFDSLLMSLETHLETFVNLNEITQIFYDVVFIINGIIFATVMVLLGIIQRERMRNNNESFGIIIKPYLSICALVFWIAVVIYKQVKLFPVPEGINQFDYYWDKTRMMSNIAQILYGFSGFLIAVEFIIKLCIQRSKISLKS